MDMDPEADDAEDMGDEAPADAEEAMDNVEDAIAELRAAFAEMQGEEPGDEEPEMDDEMESVATEEVEAVEEGASMSAVSVSHSDSSDKGSPVASQAKAPNDAKAHSIGGGDEKGRPAPTAKPMGVAGPQEAGDPSPAPKAKDEKVKSESPMKGVK